MKIGEHQLWTVDPLQLKIIWWLWEQGMQGMWASRQFISFCGAWVGLNDRSEEYQWQFRSRLHPRSKPCFLLSTVASALLAHAGPTIVNTNSSFHQILPRHLLLQLAHSSFQKKWRCPKLGVALNNPFGSRIFHYKLDKPSSYGGTPMTMETPK